VLHIPAIVASGMRASLFDRPGAWFASRIVVYAGVSVTATLLLVIGAGLYSVLRSPGSAPQPFAPVELPPAVQVPVIDRGPPEQAVPGPVAQGKRLQGARPYAHYEIEQGDGEIAKLRRDSREAGSLTKLRGFLGGPIYGPSGRELGKIVSVTHARGKNYVLFQLTDGSIAGAPANTVILTTNSGKLVTVDQADTNTTIQRVEFVGAFYNLEQFAPPRR
jgi:hypothetical protein